MHKKRGRQMNILLIPFVKSPSLKKAEQLMKGAFWNGDVFAFKLEYAIQIPKKHNNSDSYQEIYDRYGELKKISFDYEVVEKAENIRMALYNGYWKDLGTWNTLTDRIEDAIIG